MNVWQKWIFEFLSGRWTTNRIGLCADVLVWLCGCVSELNKNLLSFFFSQGGAIGWSITDSWGVVHSTKMALKWIANNSPAMNVLNARASIFEIWNVACPVRCDFVFSYWVLLSELCICWSISLRRMLIDFFFVIFHSSYLLENALRGSDSAFGDGSIIYFEIIFAARNFSRLRRWCLRNYLFCCLHFDRSFFAPIEY